MGVTMRKSGLAMESMRTKGPGTGEEAKGRVMGERSRT